MLTEDHFATIEPGLQAHNSDVRNAAFERLVSKFRKREIAQLRQRFRTQSEHVVSEIVNEAFLEFWKAMQVQGWEEKWQWSYFRGITRNLGLRAAKKLTKAKSRFFKGEREEDLLPSQDGGLEDYAASSSDTGQKGMESEHEKIIDEVVSKMPEQQRRIAVIMKREFDNPRLGPALIVRLYQTEYGKVISTAAAKGALAVVKEKIRKAIFRLDEKDH